MSVSLSDFAYDPSKQVAEGKRGCFFISQFPSRYVQGPGVLDEAGNLLKHVSGSPVLIMSAGSIRRGFAQRLERSFADRKCHVLEFGGECTLAEISSIKERVEQLLQQQQEGEKEERGAFIACVGGGKVIDSGRAVAALLKLECVVVPTVASNDSPCSALSVVYTPEHSICGIAFYPRNPTAVLVDSEVIANAPVKLLIAGMGDALATFFEARANKESKEKEQNCVGGRSLHSALMMAQGARDLIYKHGEAALAAAREKKVTPDLEALVEASVLLSGVGFESCGVAFAHGFTYALTSKPEAAATEHGFLVNVGLVVQLTLEKRLEERQQVLEFSKKVGLPYSIAHVGVKEEGEALKQVAKDLAQHAMKEAICHNLPLKLTEDLIAEAILEATEAAAKI